MPRALWWSLGGRFVSYERGTQAGRCGEVPRQVDLQGYLTQPPAPPLGPYCMPMPRVKRGFQRGERFLISEAPLYGEAARHIDLQGHLT